MTKEFLDWLGGTLTVEVYVSPFVRLPKERLSTENPDVAKVFEMKPIDCQPDADDIEEQAPTPRHAAEDDDDDDDDKNDEGDGEAETIASLKKALAAKEEENASLKQQLEEAQQLIRQLQGGKGKSKIEEARAADRALNGS